MKIIKTEIKEKSRKLNAKWTVTLDLETGTDYNANYEEMSNALQEEIDWEIIMDMMKAVGYTHISMPWPAMMRDSQAHEIKEWCRANLKEHHKGRGQDWLFKSQRDASMFVLRWS